MGGGRFRTKALRLAKIRKDEDEVMRLGIGMGETEFRAKALRLAKIRKDEDEVMRLG
jgi:hypothetical protein